jgi:hypothetical protein
MFLVTGSIGNPPNTEILKNLITYLDDPIIIQVGYQSSNTNTK